MVWSLRDLGIFTAAERKLEELGLKYQRGGGREAGASERRACLLRQGANAKYSYGVQPRVQT